VIKLSSPSTREFWEIPILFEDAQVLALDKPAGLPVSPEPDSPERPNLLKLLHEGIADGKPWAREHGLDYLMSVHRLDSESSGVLLFAKTKAVFHTLANLFGSEKPLLKFIALVCGVPTQEQFEVTAKLSAQPAQAGFFRIDPRRGKRAVTRFSILEKFSGWTLLACEPLTLRPHQIRAHLRQAGLPVVGDRLYGGKPLLLSSLKRGYHLKPNQVERPLLAGVALHSEQITLPPLLTSAPLTIVAPWPKDFTVALKYLRRLAR
jgi:RluA family pseudouridine synthase